MRREKISMIASQRLIELLSRMNHQISYELSEMIRWKTNTVISYLDFGDEEDSVTFIYSNKLIELMDENLDTCNSRAWVEKRSEMRIGKIIKLIFKDRYPINMPKGDNYTGTPYDIETFVNIFKKERNKKVNYKNFSEVKGSTLVKWYNYKQHTRFANEETSLGKSCMRHDKASNFLKMYALNEDKVNMLILKDDEGKIKARALIWYLDNMDRILMDRIYSVNDFDIELFKDYAKERGWLHKYRQTYGWSQPIVDTRNNNVLSWEKIYMEVRLKNYNFKKYPYLDTLSVFNPTTGVLCNNGDLLRKKPYLHLMDYQGNYLVEYEDRDMIFSQLYNREILRSEAIYCSIDNDYVRDGDQIYVHNTGGEFATRGSNRIVETQVINKKIYFLRDYCIFSEYMNSWIFKESSKIAYLDKNKKEKVLIHRRLIGKFFEEKNGNLFKIVWDGKGETPKYYDYREQISKHLNPVLDQQPQRRRNISSMGSNPFNVIGLSRTVPTSDRSVVVRNTLDRLGVQLQDFNDFNFTIQSASSRSINSEIDISGVDISGDDITQGVDNQVLTGTTSNSNNQSQDSRPIIANIIRRNRNSNGDVIEYYDNGAIYEIAQTGNIIVLNRPINANIIQRSPMHNGDTVVYFDNGTIYQISSTGYITIFRDTTTNYSPYLSEASPEVVSPDARPEVRPVDRIEDDIMEIENRPEDRPVNINPYDLTHIVRLEVRPEVRPEDRLEDRPVVRPVNVYDLTHHVNRRYYSRRRRRT